MEDVLLYKSLPKGGGWSITVDPATYEIEMRKVDLFKEASEQETMSIQAFIQAGMPGSSALKRMIMGLVDA
jgi:hypothetical protein